MRVKFLALIATFSFPFFVAYAVEPPNPERWDPSATLGGFEQELVKAKALEARSRQQIRLSGASDEMYTKLNDAVKNGIGEGGLAGADGEFSAYKTAISGISPAEISKIASGWKQEYKNLQKSEQILKRRIDANPSMRSVLVPRLEVMHQRLRWLEGAAGLMQKYIHL